MKNDSAVQNIKKLNVSFYTRLFDSYLLKYIPYLILSFDNTSFSKTFLPPLFYHLHQSHLICSSLKKLIRDVHVSSFTVPNLGLHVNVEFFFLKLKHFV